MTYSDMDLIAAVTHFASPDFHAKAYLIVRSPRAPLRVWARNQREARRIEREYRVRIEGRDTRWLRAERVTSVERTNVAVARIEQVGSGLYHVRCECGWASIVQGRRAREIARERARFHRAEHVRAGWHPPTMTSATPRP